MNKKKSMFSMKAIQLYWHNSYFKTCNFSCIFKGVKLSLMELKCIYFHATLTLLFISHHVFSCGYQPIRHAWPKFTVVKLRLSLRHKHNLFNTKRHVIGMLQIWITALYFQAKHIFPSTIVLLDFYPSCAHSHL